MKNSKATIDEVYNYWNNCFLYSMELTEEPGTLEFYDAINKLRTEDIELYSYEFWEFDKHKEEKVLDIGCGPGWLVRNYSANGANISAIDLTDVAVNLTQKMLEIYNLSADVRQANAECLPYNDNSFDLVVSSGVLHHAPNMQKAVDEAYRVLKPGKYALISIYHKKVFMNDVLFPIFMKIYNLFQPCVPGRNKMKAAKDPDDFIRMYDGDNNPVGYGLTMEETYQMFKKFEVVKYEIHFFPKRFFPMLINMPDFIYRFFDKNFGTMIYLKLRKPD